MCVWLASAGAACTAVIDGELSGKTSSETASPGEPGGAGGTSKPSECARADDCQLAHATARCSAGSCEIDACREGFADCDGEPADGCEARLESDEQHCGECDHACSADERCKKGKCK